MNFTSIWERNAPIFDALHTSRKLLFPLLVSAWRSSLILIRITDVLKKMPHRYGGTKNWKQMASERIIHCLGKYS
jgi:hypothetical protein